MFLSSSKLTIQTIISIFLVPNYLLGGEIHTREFVAPDVKENGIDNYGFAEQRLQQVTEPEIILEDNSPDQSNGSLQNTVTSLPDHIPPSVEEPIGEPQKHTYASIVCSKTLKIANNFVYALICSIQSSFKYNDFLCFILAGSYVLLKDSPRRPWLLTIPLTRMLH